MIFPDVETIQTVAEKINPGDWFFAVTVKGEDGHDKINLALSRGAIAITTELGRTFEIPGGVLHEVVANPRETLFSRAIAKRSRLSTKIAVIAGSNGKTTVKEMVVSVLKESGLAFGSSPDNQNTKIGVATTLLRMSLDTQIAVFEVGARHLGDFQVPLEMLKPSLVCLLNVGTAHVGEFGSIENLRREKLSILDAKSAETLVIPQDDPLISHYVESKLQKIVRFSSRQNQFTYQAPASDLNFAAARAICESLGLSCETVSTGLAKFQGVARRFERIQIGTTCLIDDAFNSSPESARHGLNQVASIFVNKKILLVLGSMLELGQDAVDSHRQVGKFIEDHPILRSATIITIGEDAKEICPAAPHFCSVEIAYPAVQVALSSFDIVYFKASRSIGFERLIRRLRD